MKSTSAKLPKKPLPSSLRPSRTEGSSEPSTPKAGPIPWTPEPYQVEAAKFLVQRSCAGLFLDPGLRKTSIVLAVLKTLFKKKLARRAVVVAPPRVCKSVWPAEVAKWADFCGLKTVVLHGLKKDKLLEEDADLYIVSYNSLDWFLDAEKVKSEKTGKVTIRAGMHKVRKLGVDVLVCDEISKARNPNSITFKLLKAARDEFAYVYGMTGSPAPRSLLDLFGIMNIIDGGYSLGPYITHYRSAYFVPSGFGGFDYKLQPDGAERIYDRIGEFVFRLDAKDYIKLPRLVENIVRVELPPEARKTYDDMEKEFFAELDQQGIMAVNGGSAYMKCRQIANGGLYKNKVLDEQGIVAKGPRDWFDLHAEKAQAVADMVEELNGSPALVVYDFHHDLARLKKALGEKTPHIGSGVTTKASDVLVEKWNRNELPVLLVHAGSMAHGLNMQGGNASHVLWHSLTDNYELYDQTIRRLLRSGNESSHVFSHLFVADDTVDEIMLKRAAKKALTQKELNDAMKEYTLRRRRGRK
jgi:SNF2 family DNA or RNA helicase